MTHITIAFVLIEWETMCRQSCMFDPSPRVNEGVPWAHTPDRSLKGSYLPRDMRIWRGYKWIYGAMTSSLLPAGLDQRMILAKRGGTAKNPN